MSLPNKAGHICHTYENNNYINKDNQILTLVSVRQPLAQDFKQRDYGIACSNKMTEAQIKPIACVIKLLLKNYNLTLYAIYV